MASSVFSPRTKREGSNEYKTRFAIFGFQYIMVETDIAFAPENLTLAQFAMCRKGKRDGYKSDLVKDDIGR